MHKFSTFRSTFFSSRRAVLNIIYQQMKSGYTVQKTGFGRYNINWSVI